MKSIECFSIIKLNIWQKKNIFKMSLKPLNTEKYYITTFFKHLYKHMLQKEEQEQETLFTCIQIFSASKNFTFIICVQPWTNQ